MLGKLVGMRRLFGGDFEITFSTKEDFREMYDSLSKFPVKVEIRKAASRRSLDANAFAWVLIDKIAEVSGRGKKEVYREAIRDIGGVSDTVCAVDEAVERICKRWESRGDGWQAVIMPSKVEGCKNITLYYGSSVYDTAQMSRLIDLLIQEAEQQGIPTLRDEADKLVRKWGQ